MLNPTRQEYDVAKKRLDNAQQLMLRAQAIIEETEPIISAYYCAHTREIMAETCKYEVFLSFDDDAQFSWVPVSEDVLKERSKNHGSGFLKRLVREKRIRRLMPKCAKTQNFIGEANVEN